jgi:ABC-type nickel/cobalt efflux system permease component RcnA
MVGETEAQRSTHDTTHRDQRTRRSSQPDRSRLYNSGALVSFGPGTNAIRVQIFGRPCDGNGSAGKFAHVHVVEVVCNLCGGYLLDLLDGDGSATLSRGAPCCRGLPGGPCVTAKFPPQVSAESGHDHHEPHPHIRAVARHPAQQRTSLVSRLPTRRSLSAVSFPTADNELCLLLLAMTSLAFLIPVSLEVVFSAGTAMEVAALATAWKGIEDS